VVVYGSRSAARTLDWRSADIFYPRLVETSPGSAKSHYFYGAYLAARGDDGGAVEAYNRAIAIFPAYAEAYHNRGNALARLGRVDEAAASYQHVLRFDPGHGGARQNLAALAQGLRINPPRKRM
jgi:tetratricopeptide (TPR) repeat protein